MSKPVKFTVINTNLTARSLRTVLGMGPRLYNTENSVERDQPVIKFSTPDYASVKDALDAAGESYRCAGSPSRPH